MNRAYKDLVFRPSGPWDEVLADINEYDGKLREYGLWAADADCKAITPHGDSIECEFPGDDYTDGRTEKDIATQTRKVSNRGPGYPYGF